MFSVCLIDDDKSLHRIIKSKIDCIIDIKSLKDVNIYNDGLIKDRIIKSFPYDLVIFDGSLEENDLDSVSVIEKLLLWNSDAKNKVILLIGNDIIEYTKPDDFDAYSKIQRSKKLPYKIHGGKNGTKVDNIINLIKSAAKRKNMVINDRFQNESIEEESKELLKKLINNYKKIYEYLINSIDIINQINGKEKTIDIKELLKEFNFKNFDFVHFTTGSVEKLYLILSKYENLEKTNSDEDDNDFSLSKKYNKN